MPYLDEGQSKEPRNLPPVLPWLVVVVVAGLTPVLWLGSHLWFGYSYAGALFAGLLVGLAAKFMLNKPILALRIAAIALVVIGSFAGFVWVDSQIWKPFLFDQTMQRFSRDIFALLMIGAGGYIAFVLAEPRRR